MVGVREHVDGIGEQVLERRLGRAEQRAVAVERGDLHPHLLADGGQRVVDASVDRAADQREEQPQVAAEDDDLGVEEVDQVRQPDAEPLADALDGGLRLAVAERRPPAMTSATSTWSSPIPAARVIASRPISVSQQPWAPQRQITPVGLTTMWPTSPP